MRIIPLIVAGVISTQVNASSLCDSLAATARTMSTQRQVGYSYDAIVRNFAVAAAQTNATPQQLLALDRGHRFIASKVFAVPLQDTSAALQQASDEQLAADIRNECLQAQSEL